MKLTKKQLDELTGGGKTPKDVESLYSQMLQHMIMAVECECAGDRRSRCLRPDYRKLAGQSLVVPRESSHSSVMKGARRLLIGWRKPGKTGDADRFSHLMFWIPRAAYS